MSKRAKILELSAKRLNTLGFDRFSGKLTVVGALSEGYLYQSTVYFLRRLREEHLLDKPAENPDTRDKTLRILKNNYTGDSADTYYIGDALLDFHLIDEYTSVQSSGSRIQENPDTQHSSIQQLQPRRPWQKIHCLLLLEGGYTDMLSAHYCLILQKHQSLFPDSHPDYYRRIGICAFNTRHICLSFPRVCTGQHKGYSDCMGTIQKVQIS